MGIWAAHSDFLPKRDSIETERKKYLQGKETWDFPGGSVVRTLCFHCRGPLRGSGNARGVQCGQKKKKIWQIGPSTSGRWSRLTSREKNHVDRIFLQYDVMRMTFYVYGFIPPNRKLQDFPGGSVVRNLPAKVGDTDSIPGQGGFYTPRMQLSSWATTTGPVL